MSARHRKLRMEQMEARQMFAVLTGFTPSPDASLVNGGLLDGGSTPQDISYVTELPLQSLPGAKATLFLDFNGHVQNGAVGDVAGFSGWNHFTVPQWDTNGDPYHFSPDEQQQIKFIWQSVAEDYAPFNINVTTIDPNPGGFGASKPYMHVVITSGQDDITGRHFLGFSKVGAYASGSDPNVAFVFGEEQGGSRKSIEFVANAASHEAGHAFGLNHYTSTSGNSSRSPIMREYGASSNSERVTWAQAGKDMEKIAGSSNGFGYRADDHSNKTSSATQLVATNVGLFGKGLIEKTSDVDTFRFDTAGGNVSIRVELPTGIDPNHPRSPENLANLDPSLKLLDSNGKVLATDSDPTLLASLTKNLVAGTYYVQVGSYGNYGDVGQYSLFVKEDQGAKITSSQFVTVNSTQMALLVTFNETITAATFTDDDVRINGNAAGLGVVSITTSDSKSFLVNFTVPGNTTTLLGTSVSIGPYINDLLGNTMDQNGNHVNGESVDAFIASYQPMNYAAKTVSTPKKTKLNAKTVDAAFAA